MSRYSARSLRKPALADSNICVAKERFYYINIDEILGFFCCVKIISSHVKIKMTSSQPGMNFDIYRSCMYINSIYTVLVFINSIYTVLVFISKVY